MKFRFKLGKVGRVAKRAGSAAGRAAKRVAAVPRKEASKYVPLYGPQRTLGGTKLTSAQQTARTKAKKRDVKHTRKIVRKVWRKLI